MFEKILWAIKIISAITLLILIINLPYIKWSIFFGILFFFLVINIVKTKPKSNKEFIENSIRKFTYSPSSDEENLKQIKKDKIIGIIGIIILFLCSAYVKVSNYYMWRENERLEDALFLGVIMVFALILSNRYFKHLWKDE